MSLDPEPDFFHLGVADISAMWRNPPTQFPS